MKAKNVALFVAFALSIIINLSLLLYNFTMKVKQDAMEQKGQKMRDEIEAVRQEIYKMKQERKSLLQNIDSLKQEEDQSLR